MFAAGFCTYIFFVATVSARRTALIVPAHGSDEAIGVPPPRGRCSRRAAAAGSAALGQFGRAFRRADRRAEPDLRAAALRRAPAPAVSRLRAGESADHVVVRGDLGVFPA